MILANVTGECSATSTSTKSIYIIVYSRSMTTWGNDAYRDIAGKFRGSGVTISSMHMPASWRWSVTHSWHLYQPNVPHQHHARNVCTAVNTPNSPLTCIHTHTTTNSRSQSWIPSPVAAGGISKATLQAALEAPWHHPLWNEARSRTPTHFLHSSAWLTLKSQM